MWTNFEVFTEFITRLLLFCVLVFWPGDIWDPRSPAREGTGTPSIGRRSLNRWSTREVPGLPMSANASLCVTFINWYILHYLLTLKSISTSFQEFDKRHVCCTKSGDSGEEKRGNLVIFVENMEKIQDNQSSLCWFTRGLSLPLLKSSLGSLTSSFSFCILEKETSPHHLKSNSFLQVLWFHYCSLVLPSKPAHLSFSLFHV